MTAALTLCATAWLMVGGHTPSSAAQPPGQPLSVMSFNIRYGTANDGDNHWTRRRQFVVDVVTEVSADVVGVQEALDGQIQELLDAIPDYAAIGVGRDDGRTRGEYAAILYRRARLRVAESGTFWFSDTPDVIASASWGNTIPRICTWARFVDRDGRAFWHFNVHLDHQSQPSRERSTAFLAERIRDRRYPDEPVVVTGDFNAGETNAAVTMLTTAPEGRAALLVDSYRVLHPDEQPAGTFTGFKIDATTGEKIDYVLVPPGTVVLQAEIVRTQRDGRYPSDHFPVTTRFSWADGQMRSSQ
jgi:endonuclease/exonuclease/phosphatase family metal-dependent hydrolase